MDQGRVKKYLFYATGEILLVVIGILIALQINNWNELNKERATGINYLRRIKTDLVKDTLYLDSKIEIAKTEQQNYEDFIENMYKTQDSTEEFIELISSVTWNADNLIIQDKTYTEITNSGQLNYISNPEIRNMIMDYYKNYTEYDQHISEMNQTGIDLMSDTYKKFVKYYKEIRGLFEKENIKEVHNWEYINDPSSNEFQELEGMSVYYHFKQGVFENYFNLLKADGSDLIEEIDKELHSIK